MLKLRKSIFILLSFSFLLFFSYSSLAFERIISLKPNLTEILFALGVGEQIVGVTSFCDFPPEAKKIDKVADYLQPDLERVFAKKPDLIVGSQENSSRREIEFLQNKSYRVLLFSTDTLDQLRKTILDLGIVLGKKEQAQKLQENLSADLETLRAKLKQKNLPVQRVLFVVGHQPLVVAGSNNLFQDIAPYLGLKNVAEESRLKYPVYSIEQAIVSAPDLIFDFSMGSEASARSREEILNQWKRLPQIPAVKNNQIYFLDMGQLRASPRIGQELNKIFGQIHGS